MTHLATESESVAQQAQNQQKQPRVKSEFFAMVERLKRAIRKKENWQDKLDDPVVRARYIEEAVAQGASREAIEQALSELEAVCVPWHNTCVSNHYLCWWFALVWIVADC